MKILFKSKILEITFIFFTIFSMNFQKAFSEDKFDGLNIEYLNQKRSTKYILGPGDILEINSIQFDLEKRDLVNLKQNLDKRTLSLDKYYIDGEGTINIPRLKKIFVEGLTVEELTYLLNKKYQEFFIDPNVTVRVSDYRDISVYVDGEVNLPGLYRLPGTINTTIPDIKKDDENIALKRPIIGSKGPFPRLYDALSSAGGITSYSDLSNIIIIRKNNISSGGGKVRATVDFLEVIETGTSDNNIRIYDGDIIKISKSNIDLTEQLSKAVKSNLNPRFVNVVIAGRIQAPGKIQINKSSSLNEAILMKGGIKPLSGKVNFLRYSDEGLIDKRTFRFSKNSPKGSFKNPILRDGDVIIVGQSGFNVASSILKEITSPFIGIKAVYDILD